MLCVQHIGLISTIKTLILTLVLHITKDSPNCKTLLIHLSPSRCHLFLVVNNYLISPYSPGSHVFSSPHTTVLHCRGPLIEFHIVFRDGGMRRSHTDTGVLLAVTTSVELPSATGAQSRSDLGYEIPKELGEGG